MKKGILSILAVCYFVVTCGVVVNLHFCMDRLSSTSLFGSEVKKCGRCGMDIHESNGCCRDEMKLVKLDSDQQNTVAASYDIAAMEPMELVPSVYIETAFYNIDEQRHFHNHSPPLLSGQDTYLQVSVFRI